MMVKVMVVPEMIATWGNSTRCKRPAFNIAPHSGVDGSPARPRKVNVVIPKKAQATWTVPKDKSWERAFGRRWYRMIQSVSPPSARADWIYLWERVWIKMVRLIRANPGAPLIPTAMITVVSPGPSPATRINARRRPGMESKAFENHMIKRSVQYGDEEDITPTILPKMIERRAEESEAVKLNLAP
jgi:hypothetical protein